MSFIAFSKNDHIVLYNKSINFGEKLWQNILEYKNQDCFLNLVFLMLNQKVIYMYIQ